LLGGKRIEPVLRVESYLRSRCALLNMHASISCSAVQSRILTNFLCCCWWDWGVRRALYAILWLSVCTISGTTSSAGCDCILWLKFSARRRCWQNGSLRPVLKHGPRSLTCVRVLWWQTMVRNESKRVGAPPTDHDLLW